MENYFSSRTKRGLGAFLLLALVLACIPASGGVCDKALTSCLSDALYAGIFSLNIGMLALYTTSCMLGYDWCLKYFENM